MPPGVSHMKGEESTTANTDRNNRHGISMAPPLLPIEPPKMNGPHQHLTDHEEETETKRSEFDLMWDYVDGFFNTSHSRKGSMRLRKTRATHTRNQSSASHDGQRTPIQPNHGRTVSEDSALLSSPLPPPVPPKPETSMTHGTRKGEPSFSFKGILKSRLTEMSGLADANGRKPSDLLSRKSSVKKPSSQQGSHVDKANISSPVPLDPYSLMPQACSLSIHHSERTILARAAAPVLSTSGTLTPVRRKPIPLVEQEQGTGATLQPSPKRTVQLAQRQVSQRSVRVNTEMISSEASTKGKQSLRLQADRQTKYARTTTFGDFINVSMPSHEQMPPLPQATSTAFDTLNRRSTLRADHHSDATQQAHRSDPGPLEHLPTQQLAGDRAEERRQARKYVKSEWIAAASECVRNEPLDFEPCQSCEAPFDGGSNVQKTCRGQLCGDCISRQPKCLCCGKAPFSETSKLTRYGVLCKDCADCLHHPCNFCGTELEREEQMYVKNIGWLCQECAATPTPEEIAPGMTVSHCGLRGEDRPPTPSPKSPERERGTSSKQLPPRSRSVGTGASERWPARTASLEPTARNQTATAVNGVSSSISPAILKRDHSPLSRLYQDLGVGALPKQDDASSEAMEQWQTDTPSEDETIGPSPNCSRRHSRETFAFIPLPRAQSPFTPDFRRAVSSIYPDDEQSFANLNEAPPLPDVPAAYQRRKYSLYGMPATQFEDDQQPRSGAQSQGNDFNFNKRSTLLSIVECYFNKASE